MIALSGPGEEALKRASSRSRFDLARAIKESARESAKEITKAVKASKEAIYSSRIAYLRTNSARERGTERTSDVQTSSH